MSIQAVQGPLVYVLVPFYNASQYIKEALDSIVAQSYRPLEIILVDDGSTEKIDDIIDRYDPGILKYHKNIFGNQGIAATRDLCLQFADGEYIAWLDADDIYAPGKLLAQVEYLEQNPGCDIVFTQVEDFFDSPDLATTMNGEIYKKVMFGGKEVYMASSMARKSLFARFGGFVSAGTPLYEDVCWLYRLYFVHGVDLTHCLPEIYLKKRLHENCSAYNGRSPELLAQVREKTNQYMRYKIRKNLVTNNPQCK